MPINHTKRKKMPSIIYKEMYENELISAVNSMSINKSPREVDTAFKKSVSWERDATMRAFNSSVGKYYRYH